MLMPPTSVLIMLSCCQSSNNAKAWRQRAARAQAARATPIALASGAKCFNKSSANCHLSGTVRDEKVVFSSKLIGEVVYFLCVRCLHCLLCCISKVCALRLSPQATFSLYQHCARTRSFASDKYTESKNFRSPAQAFIAAVK